MIRKPHPRTGMRQIWVYDPARRKKIYVGSRKNLRGPDGAQELERRKKTEFSGKPAPTEGMSCNDYADRWLTVKHGPGTRRPSPTTEQVNRGLLKQFRTDFGDRLLDDGITRIEALDWSKQHPTNAKAVSAMMNDALDDMLTKANPFANRRQTGSRGRRDIAPLTEQEVERLAELAYVAHGDYGDVCSAWILFLAWVGCRPSEMCQARWEHIGRDGRLTIKRVKGHKQTETIVLPDRAREALAGLPYNSGWLFVTSQGRRMDRGSLGYYWRPVRAAFVAQLIPERRAEFEAVKGSLDVYALRHACGSMMADRGLSEWDISHQLGNSPEVCRRIYVHPVVDQANDRVERAMNDSRVVDLASRRRGA